MRGVLNNGRTTSLLTARRIGKLREGLRLSDESLATTNATTRERRENILPEDVFPALLIFETSEAIWLLLRPGRREKGFGQGWTQERANWATRPT